MKKRKIPFNLNISLFAVFVVLSALSVFSVLRYLNLNRTLFIYGIILAILLNLLMLFLILLFPNKSKASPLISVVLVLLIGIFAYGFISILRINVALDKLIVNESSVEEVTTSFVTYRNTSISEVADLDNKIMGLIDNEDVLEGHILPLKEIEKLKLNVETKTYASYNDMLLGLFSQEIDFASLPEDYYSMFISNDGYEEYLDQTKTVYSFTEKVKIEDENTTRKDLTEESFSVLLMGNDGGRTDTLIYATFNPKTMIVTLTSIARDSYVPISCYKDQASDKINHSRQISRQCTLDTVGNLLNEKIDYFIEVNFQAIVKLVDALGKIWIESPVEFVGQNSSDERGHFNIKIFKGGQFMDGEQVLAFARERKHMPGGDLQRQLNQQQVIRSLMNKLLDTRDINLFLSALEATGDNVKTNLSIQQLTSLANYVIGEMNQSPLDNSYFVQMINSRLSGYFSWAYNDSLQLPLSIYKLYNGSIKDAQSLIDFNLIQNYTPENHTSFGFNIYSPYFGFSYIKDYYDEAEIHDPLPDFMPSLISSSDTWTLKRVQDWIKERSWIKLNVVEIWENDSKYSESYAYNQVISQNVKYGVKTENMTSLTIEVIKRNLDCRIEANRSDEQCLNIVPEFAGMTRDQVQSWSSANGNIVSIKLVSENNPDRSQVNHAISQSIEAYTKLKDVSSIEVTVLDYPNITIPASQMLSENWNRDRINQWIQQNQDRLYAEASIIESNSSTIPANQIMEIAYYDESQTRRTLQSDTSIKANQSIEFVISKGPVISTP